MKPISLLCTIGLIAVVYSSCNPEHVSPQQQKTPSTVSATSDTNKTLIANTSLLGTWSVITDSVSAFMIDTVYHGKAGDHYIFTKFSNVYINNTFNELIDTGVYNISHDTVKWVSSYVSQLGSGGHGVFLAGPYKISNLNNTSLVLSQYTIAGLGARYEQIVLKKEQ